MENALDQLGKSEVESRGNIPSGYLSGTKWKWTFGRVHAESVRLDLRSNLSHISLGLTPGDDRMVENVEVVE